MIETPPLRAKNVPASKFLTLSTIEKELIELALDNFQRNYSQLWTSGRKQELSQRIFRIKHKLFPPFEKIEVTP